MLVQFKCDNPTGGLKCAQLRDAVDCIEGEVPTPSKWRACSLYICKDISDTKLMWLILYL